MGKQRTITLTGRAPIKIDEDIWPVIASAEWADHDNTYEFQANRKASATIMVRVHADGRPIVCGTYTYRTQFEREADARVAGGVLLTDGSGIPAAIRETASYLSDYDSLPSGWQPDWKALADECIADLPAEQLD